MVAVLRDGERVEGLLPRRTVSKDAAHDAFAAKHQLAMREPLAAIDEAFDKEVVNLHLVAPAALLACDGYHSSSETTTARTKELTPPISVTTEARPPLLQRLRCVRCARVTANVRTGFPAEPHGPVWLCLGCVCPFCWIVTVPLAAQS